MKVFISYARPDETAAKRVSDLVKRAGIDVYLDKDDRELGVAVSGNDAARVVARIDEALRSVSHLLAVIGEATKNSWWVPYEIGVSRVRSVKLTTLVLDNAVTLPEYLQIVPMMRDRYDLRKWLNDTTGTTRMDESIVKSVTATVTRLPDFATGTVRFVPA